MKMKEYKINFDRYLNPNLQHLDRLWGTAVIHETSKGKAISRFEELTGIKKGFITSVEIDG